MSNLTDFVFDRQPPAQIINGCSDGELAGRYVTGVGTPGKSIMSGVLTADTLKEVLSVTGQGRISYLALGSNSTSSQFFTLNITMDGVVVFDATSASATTESGYGLVAVGCTYTGVDFAGFSYDSVFFNQSLSVKISSSADLTDSLELLIAYEVY